MVYTQETITTTEPVETTNSETNSDQLVKSNEKVFYIPSVNGKSVMTAATRISPDGKNIAVGIAFASKNGFSRKEGRRMAFARLNKGKGKFAYVTEFKQYSSNAVIEFSELVNDENTHIKNIIVKCDGERKQKVLGQYNRLPSAWRGCVVKSEGSKLFAVKV